MTIVMERLKPLVLKLRDPKRSLIVLGPRIKPQGDIEGTIESLGDELVSLITVGVNDIHDQVKRARPHPDEGNYEQKMIVYLELLAYVTNMISLLTEVLSDSFTELRRLVDQLWENIQPASNNAAVQLYIQDFLQASEQTFRNGISTKIEPSFTAVEAQLNEFKVRA